PLAQQLFPFTAAAFGMSTIMAFWMLNPLFERAGIARICVFLGRISYSVYLFHIMLILLLRPSLQSWPIAVQIGVYVAACVIFCTLFYYYFEKPILAARPHFKTASDVASPAREQHVGALSPSIPLQA